MSSLIAQLRENGTITLGALTGSGTVGFVQSCYNRLTSVDSLVILTSEAADMQDDLAEIIGDASRVVVCTEAKRGNKGDKSVKDLCLAFERRNALNPNALDKTFGNIHIPNDGAITNDAGKAVGFVIEAA